MDPGQPSCRYWCCGVPDSTDSTPFAPLTFPFPVPPPPLFPLFPSRLRQTFASASLDKSVKVWSLGSGEANYTLEGHERGVNCVSYYQVREAASVGV